MNVQMRQRRGDSRPISTDHSLKSSTDNESIQAADIDTFPVKLNLGALHGMRTLLCFWILLFHSLCYYSPNITNAEADGISITWIFEGFLAVDGFFTLTGFLLTRQIILREKNKQVVPKSGKFAQIIEFLTSLASTYYSRFVRIVPSLVVLVLLYRYVIFLQGEQSIVMTRQLTQKMTLIRLISENEQSIQFPVSLWDLGSIFTFLNNILPYGGKLMTLWSLAVQYQFYVWLPLLMHLLHLTKGIRLPLFVLITYTLGTVLRFVAFQHHRALPINSLAESVMGFGWYGFTWTRMHTIWGGALLAWILYSWNRVACTLRKWLYNSYTIHLIMIPFAALYFYMNAFEAIIGQAETLYRSLFTHVGSFGSSMVWCYLVYLSMNPRPIASDSKIGSSIPRILSNALTGSVWNHLSRWSFMIFLLHPVIFSRLYGDPSALLPPSEQTLPTPIIQLRAGVSTAQNVLAHFHGILSIDTSTPLNTLDSPLNNTILSKFSADQIAFLMVPVAKNDPSNPNSLVHIIDMIKDIREMHESDNYHGPIIHGTRAPTRLDFATSTLIATVCIVILSWILCDWIITPLESMFFSQYGKKILKWPVMLHGLMVVIFSVLGNALWLYTVFAYIHGGWERYFNVGQTMHMG